MAEKGQVLKTMDELDLLVDVDGLMKKGVYIRSYGSYDALVEEYIEQGWEGEVFELFEKNGVNESYNSDLLGVDDPFITIDDSNSSNGVTVYPFYESSEEIVGNLKVDYKEFIKHDSISEYNLSEVETKLENNAIDYELEENRFETVINIYDDSLEDTRIVINDSFLSLSVGFDPEPNYFEYDSLDELLQVIDKKVIKPVPLKSKSQEMEM